MRNSSLAKKSLLGFMAVGLMLSGPAALATAKPSTPAPSPTAEEWAFPDARDILEKVDAAVNVPAIGKQQRVQFPGQAVTVFKEIKKCDGKSKEDCDSGTVSKGQYYDSPEKKIAAIAYELAATYNNALAIRTEPSKKKDDMERVGFYTNKDDVLKGKTFPGAPHNNPREEASRYQGNEFDNDAVKDLPLPEKLTHVGKARKKDRDDDQFYIGVYPLKAERGDYADNRLDTTASNPLQFLQQAATIVLSDGKYEKYTALEKLANTKKEKTADDAPVDAPVDTKVDAPVAADKMVLASGEKLPAGSSFVDLHQTVKVVGDEWNIRTAPNTKGQIVGKANNGDELHTVGVDSGKENDESGAMQGLWMGKASEYDWPDSDGKMHKGQAWRSVLIPGTSKVGYIAFPIENTPEWADAASKVGK